MGPFICGNGLFVVLTWTSAASNAAGGSEDWPKTTPVTAVRQIRHANARIVSTSKGSQRRPAKSALSSLRRRWPPKRLESVILVGCPMS